MIITIFFGRYLQLLAYHRCHARVHADITSQLQCCFLQSPGSQSSEVELQQPRPTGLCWLARGGSPLLWLVSPNPITESLNKHSPRSHQVPKVMQRVPAELSQNSPDSLAGRSHLENHTGSFPSSRPTSDDWGTGRCGKEELR